MEVGPDTISAVSFKVYCMVIIIICLFFMKFTKIFGKLGNLESLNSLGLGVALGGAGVGMGLWGVAFAYLWCNRPSRPIPPHPTPPHLEPPPTLDEPEKVVFMNL